MIVHAIREYNKQNGFGRLSPKVVLFDMDGTLVNSMPNHAIAWTRMFEQIGITFTTEDAYASEGARGVETIKKYVLAQQGKRLTEEEAIKIYEEKARIFASLPTPQIMDGALELMEKVKESGLKIGIVTGSAQRTLLEKILLGFGKYVSQGDLITAFDVKKGKPDPEPYLKGMEKCGGFAPNETVIIENAPLGIRSGKASGAFTIAVNTGPLKDELLLSEGADMLFKTLTELAQNWDEFLSEALRSEV